MNLLSAGKVAFRSLRANKMRSILTMLGMIIGVAAVIIMVAIGEGANQRISAQIASVGSNLLLVLPGSTTSSGLRMGSGGAVTLTMADARAIGKELSSVKAASPTSRATGPVVYGNQNWTTVLQGGWPEYLELRDWNVVSGRNFTQQEMEASAKVCLLGQTVAETLFGIGGPFGENRTALALPFHRGRHPRPEGAVAPGAGPGRHGGPPRHHPAEKTFPRGPSGDRRRHHGAGGRRGQRQGGRAAGDRPAASAPPDRTGETTISPVRNLSEMLALPSPPRRIMSLLLGGIASVSLLVGGIGIMNIMLVSVTERTREIGIRMAVGARERDILCQFLDRGGAAPPSPGGVVGILLGAGGAVLPSQFAGWTAVISPSAVFLAFGFSAAVGVFFGFYPARKASRMDPIEALRYE